jgi:hypothetical protein
MQNAMGEVNRHNRAQGLPELEMGIGQQIPGTQEVASGRASGDEVFAIPEDAESLFFD